MIKKDKLHLKKVKAGLLKKNPKVDQKVISAAKILQDKLLGTAKPKQGSDYRISPPLGGELLMLRLRGKVSNNNI